MISISLSWLGICGKSYLLPFYRKPFFFFLKSNTVSFSQRSVMNKIMSFPLSPVPTAVHCAAPTSELAFHLILCAILLVISAERIRAVWAVETECAFAEACRKDPWKHGGKKACVGTTSCRAALLSPFTNIGWKSFGQACGVCGAAPGGEGSVIWEEDAIVADHTDVSILSSPPSCLLSSQSVASATRTGLGWATTMLTPTSPAKRVMKPASRRPALPLSTEMKTTNVSTIFPFPLRSFSGMLPLPCHCLAEAGVIAWLRCEWLGPGCLELISCSSHGCWLS